MKTHVTDERIDSAIKAYLSTRAEEIAARAQPLDVVALDLRTRLSTSRRRFMPSLSVASVAFILLLLAALLVALAVVGSLPRDPGEIVRRSQAVYNDPPPFTMVTTNGPHATVPGWYTACGDPSELGQPDAVRWRYDHDGAGGFRQACLYGGPPARYLGGFEVQTPAGHGVWNGAFWELLPPGFLNRPPGTPLVTPLWLNWLDERGQLVDCREWKLGAVEQLAGRAARLVSCEAEEYWIDEASMLLVKRAIDGETVAQAVQLTVGTRPPADLFTIHPAGFQARLAAGYEAPEIVLPTVDGGSWSSAGLTGRPAAVLSQPGCTEPCVTLDDFVRVVAARSDQLNAAAIQLADGKPYRKREVDAATAAGVPVVVDDASRWPRWDPPRFGVALFEADGTLAAIVDPPDRDSLGALIDALLAGQAIPTPPLPAAGSPAPRVVFTSSAEPHYSLEVGEFTSGFWQAQVREQGGELFTSRYRGGDYQGGLWVIRPREVYEPGARYRRAPVPPDLVAWLSSHPDLKVARVQPGALAGRPAVAMDAEEALPDGVRRRDLVPVSETGEGGPFIDRGWRYRFYVVETDTDAPLLLMFETFEEQWDGGLLMLEQLLATFEFVETPEG